MALGSVELDFGDGKYLFRLGAGELRQIQEACKCGPLVLFNRLRMGDWTLDDVREPIRLGLLAGGAGIVASQDVKVTPAIVARLMADYVDRYADPDPARTLLANAATAGAIIGAAIVGHREEPLGNGQGEGETEADLPPSPTDKSDGLQSSPPSPTGA